MKLFFFLFNVIIIMALITVNYHRFNQASHTFTLLKELSIGLDIRGRQRYEVQNQYTKLIEHQKPEIRTDIFEETGISAYLSNNNEAKNYYPILSGWDYISALNQAHQELYAVKNEYLSALLEKPITQENISNIDYWSKKIIGLLDKIQALDIQLSNYLLEGSIKQLKSTVYINAATIIILFSFVLFALYYDHRNSIKQIQSAKQLLELRQKSLFESKRLLISLMEDLSREKDSALELSEKLKQTNDNMRRKNEEMEQFIYTVSHDLKSPLVSISGFARKLTNEFDNKLSARQSDYLTRIQNNIDHMETLLTDLLQLSRVIRQELDKSIIDIEEIVLQQCKIIDVSTKAADATIIFDKPLHNIFANKRLLSQCLLNLLTNAVKYRDQQRPLRIEISTMRDDLDTKIRIKDNGIGIDDKYHELIFRIFERLDQGDGTGVGLAIVKAIMEKHNGTVTLESIPGVGSTFNLIFPNQ